MEKPVSEQTTPLDAERIDQVLRSVDHFRPNQTRRRFVEKLLAVGSGAALAAGATVLGTPTVARAASDSDILAFGSAAVGAERIGITLYDNALGVKSPYGVSQDVAKGTLLNSAHREYFMAAANQETDHLATLVGLGLTFPYSTFAFPAGTFDSASSMLAFGEKLESIFIGAYLGAIKTGASVGDSLGILVAELAAQILGVECEHRVMIRDIAGQDPPNDRFYEGDQSAATGATLGNSGTRSTVYASGSDAVAALVALGISPS